MAASTSLMDMPQEILVLILRAYFAGVEVNLIHPDSRLWDKKKWQWSSERPQPQQQNFLSPMLANKTLHSISSELYFEHATFHFNKKQQARLYQKAPTDQSKKLRYVSGFLDPLVDGEFAKQPIKETFPQLQQMTLKASMGTDTYVYQINLGCVKDLQEAMEAQNVPFIAYLNLTYTPVSGPRSISKPQRSRTSREPQRSIKVMVRKGGSVQLFETRHVDQDIYDKIKKDLQAVFGGDACRGWPGWQSDKRHCYREVDWQK